jgi:hypothetical protein
MLYNSAKIFTKYSEAINFFVRCAIFLTFFVQPVRASTADDFKIHWLKLLHFERSHTGSYESRVDDPKFFLSEKGKNGPEGELEVFLVSLQDPVKRTGIACRFPARIRLLQQYGMYSYPVHECENLKEWRETLGAKHVSLLFASQYTGNPASRFGHTFIRFNKHKAESGSLSSISDPIATYAAEIGPDVDSFTYAWDGLFGGFRGYFSVDPLFEKLREYSRFEDRDIWEYKLDLTENEIAFLIDHLYELKNSWFKYWFLSENCSYQILAAIEASIPKLELVKQFPYITLPVETINALRAAGKTSTISLYPSVSAQLFEKLRGLNSVQKDVFREITSHNQLQLPNDPEILEAVIQYHDYFIAKEKKVDNRVIALRQQALNRRVLLPPSNSIVETRTKKKPPHLSPPISLIEIGIVQTSTDETANDIFFRYRPLVHSLIDSDVGLNSNEDLTFLDISGVYLSDSSKYDWQRILAFRNAVFKPWTFFERPLSWDVELGFEKTHTNNNIRRSFLESKVKLGATIDVVGLTFFGLGSGFYYQDLSDHASNAGGPGITAGTTFGNSHLKVLLQSEIWRNIVSNSDRLMIRSEKLQAAYFMQRQYQLNVSIESGSWRDEQQHVDGQIGLAFLF